MNERTFLQRFEENAEGDRLVSCHYNAMVRFCQKEGITIDEIGTDTLEELAEGIVTRGLAVSPKGEMNKYRADE